MAESTPSIRTEIKNDCSTLIVIKLVFVGDLLTLFHNFVSALTLIEMLNVPWNPGHTSSLLILCQTIIPSEHSLRANSTMTEERLRACTRLCTQCWASIAAINTFHPHLFGKLCAAAAGRDSGRRNCD